MKQVGIFTFHNATNVGAALQAYALQKSVENIGYKCCIIDIDFWTELVNIDFFDDLTRQYGYIQGTKKYINRLFRGYYSRKHRVVNFASFRKKYMLLSQKYNSVEDISSDEYYAVLFGSDQIWSEYCCEGFRSEYFGAGFGDGIRKISYAASNGMEYIPEDLKKDVLPLLNDFYRISVREEGLAKFLTEEYELNACTVADPTLLISADEWRKLKVNNYRILKNKKYIFVYTFDDPDVYQYARDLSKKYNMPIVNYRWCGPHERFSDMIQLCNGGPQEFLTLLDNAEIVCTSSFHGTALSVILHKPFVSVADGSYSARITNFMKIVKLDKNIVKYNNRTLYHNLSYNFNETDKYIDDIKEKSIGFIKEALM